jgi:hypothetical protein
MIKRRDFLRIWLTTVAAPAIVRASFVVGDGVALQATEYPLMFPANAGFPPMVDETLEEMLAIVRQGAYPRVWIVDITSDDRRPDAR